MKSKTDIPSSAMLRQAQHMAGGYGIVGFAANITIPYPLTTSSPSDDGILCLPHFHFFIRNRSTTNSNISLYLLLSNLYYEKYFCSDFCRFSICSCLQ